MGYRPAYHVKLATDVASRFIVGVDVTNEGAMSDLTSTEQTNVRSALRFLRSRCGTWSAVSRGQCRLREGCNARDGLPRGVGRESFG
jgi:hypothetical protein